MRTVILGASSVIALVACAGASAASAQPLAGAKLFEANCQVCHQEGGVGVRGQFPRLAGRAAVIASSAAGRDFLSKLVLNGMSGVVSVDGQNIVGVMPGFGFLSDAELASVLTYVSGLDAEKTKPKAFKSTEIAVAREAGKAGQIDVVSLRNRLAADKVIP